MSLSSEVHLQLDSKSFSLNASQSLAICTYQDQVTAQWRERNLCWIDPTVPGNRLIDIDGRIEIVPYSFGEGLGRHVIRPLIDVMSSAAKHFFSYTKVFVKPFQRIDRKDPPLSMEETEAFGPLEDHGNQVSSSETTHLAQKKMLTDEEQHSLGNTLFRMVRYDDLDAVRSTVQANPCFDLNTILDPNLVHKNRFTLLTEAVMGRSLMMVRLLCELGANPNIPDPLGNTPVSVAVVMEEYSILRLFRELGANFNKPLYDNCVTPMTVAVSADLPDMIRFLHELGADINACDGHQLSPLHIALLDRKYDLVPLLLSLGANAQQIISDCFLSPLAITLLQRNQEMSFLLQSHGADLEEGSFLAQTHRVAMVWGLPGTMLHADAHGAIHQGNLECVRGIESTILLSEYVESFFQSDASAGLTLLEKMEIKDALESAYEEFSRVKKDDSSDSSLIIKRIVSKKPTLMFLGLEEHRIGILISDRKLYVCNRGAGTTRSGIEIYSWDDFSASYLVNQLKTFQTLKELPRLLSVLSFHYEGGIDQHPQKTGNCLFASAKSAFLALVYDIIDNRIPDPKIRLDSAKDIYKKFTAHCRRQSLEEYYSVHPSQTVLLKVQKIIAERRQYTLQETKKTIDEQIAKAQKKQEQLVVLEHNKEELQFEQILKEHDFKNIQDLFLQAVRSNHLSLVKKIAASFPSVDFDKLNHNGGTALAIALTEGYEEMARLLKELGVNVNNSNSKGWTPLTQAVLRKNATQVQFVIKELGADLNIPDKYGNTALTTAVSGKDPIMVRFLHTLGADLDVICQTGATALTLAVKEKNAEMVKLLVELGADINKRNGARETPLLCTIMGKYPELGSDAEMARLLVELGADINYKYPLFSAVYMHDVTMVRFLHAQGAILDAISESSGLSALTAATSSIGDPEMVKLLVELGADINKADGNKKTPLVWAVHRKDHTMVRFLHALGANLNAMSGTGQTAKTALTFAHEKNNSEMIKLLLDLGAGDPCAS